MANATIKLGSEEFTLSLNFNTTVALLTYQEAAAAKRGEEATGGDGDVRGLLARIADKKTPMSQKVTLVRTMLWAFIASEQHPEWLDDPLGTAQALGNKIGLFEIDKVNQAITAITNTIAEATVAEIESAAKVNPAAAEPGESLSAEK